MTLTILSDIEIGIIILVLITCMVLIFLIEGGNNDEM